MTGRVIFTTIGASIVFAAGNHHGDMDCTMSTHNKQL